jgi:ElaB/YqjD/DUF883 family membrane-anchored ribosome-binding protein
MREAAAMTQSNDATVLETAAATAASIQSELSTTMQSASELASAACKLADQRAREHPWTLALLAGAVGVIIGACLARR